jgi:TonB family protein
MARYAAMASVAVAGSALAQDSDPQWLQAPRLEDIRAVWPDEALRSARGGQATINCLVTVQGVLTDCAVVSERPEGLGFGRAAAMLAGQFHFKPAMKDGVATATRVNVPIVFPQPKSETGTRFRRLAPHVPTFSDSVVSGVVWRQAPGLADMVAAYPPKARERGVGGRATLSCLMNSEGLLASCETLNAEPEGLGIAEAALGLRARFVAEPTLPDGHLVAGSKVHIPVTFAPDMLSGQAPLVSKVDWLALPEADQIAGGFPSAAKSAGVSTGRTRLECAVVAEGRLEGCAVLSEEPSGLGFGQAAMALTGGFRVGAWTAEGLPTIGAKIRIPLRYEDPAKASAAGGP